MISAANPLPPLNGNNQFRSMRLSWLLFTFFLMIASFGQSQENIASSRLRVAVFTQLFLDSSFNEKGLYKHDMMMPN